MDDFTGIFSAARSVPFRRITACVFCLALSAASELHAAIYYVACDTGNDTHGGLSEAEAWRLADYNDCSRTVRAPQQFQSR